jgi:hypothetical protein
MHICQVRHRISGVLGHNHFVIWPWGRIGQHSHQLPQMSNRADASTRSALSLMDGSGRNYRIEISEHPDHRRNSRHRTDRPVQPKLTHATKAGHRCGRDIPVCSQHPNRNRKIQCSPGFAMTRGCEIDRDPPVRPGQSGTQDGSSNSISRLSTIFIGKTHHGEPRKPISDMHLNSDSMTCSTQD